MKKLRISSTFNLYCRTKKDLGEHVKDGLAFYRDHGFDAADFSMTLLELSKEGWQADVAKVIAASNESDVRFEICHLPFLGGGGFKDEAHKARFDAQMHNAIDAAVMLGVKHAVLHPNAATVPLKSFDEAAQYDAVMSHLALYAEHAARVGLSVAVENMRVVHGMRLPRRYGQTPEDVCKLADALGFGVCWDFGHANISGIKQSEGLAYVGRRLKVVHVNDNTGVDDDHVAPFMGNVDWRDAMHGLALCGFDGLLNYEVAAYRQPAATRAAFAEYLADAAKELMTYIE